MILQHVLCVNLQLTHHLLLVEDVVIDELFLILLVDDLIGLAFGESMVDVFDGFEADCFGLPGEI